MSRRNPELSADPIRYLERPIWCVSQQEKLGYLLPGSWVLAATCCGTSFRHSYYRGSSVSLPCSEWEAESLIVLTNIISGLQPAGEGVWLSPENSSHSWE